MCLLQNNWLRTAPGRYWPAGFFILLMLLFSLTRDTAAQKVSYEGLKVVRIEISAYPAVKESELRPLIVQRVDEPYSTDKVRTSMAALYATGRFHDIQVEAKLEINGVALTFILQPTFYIGIVNVTGTDKAFTANRVIEGANLPSQEVYTRDKIADATAQLVRFLKNNGYFAAEIEPDVQFDDLTRRANVTFHVRLNKPARIGEAKILGAEGLDPAHLRQAMHLKSGSKFTADALERAQDRLRRDLAKHDFLAATIRLSERTFQPATNTVDLTYEIHSGPPVIVTVQGDKLSKKQLQNLVPVHEEASFDRDLVEEGRRNMVNYYQRKGYFDAEIDVDVKRNEKVDIDYTVNKGAKSRVSDIDFTGNHHFSSQFLSEEIRIRPARFLSPGVFNEDLLRRSVNTITALYRQHGYEEAKVTEKVVKNDGHIDIVFQIAEGPRTVVESLDIEGAHEISKEMLLRSIKLRREQPFSEKLLMDDRDQILATYYDEGFPNAQFRFQVVRLPDNPHRVRVTYQIAEGPRVRIEGLYVAGNHVTKTEFIKESVDLHSGQPLSMGKLLEQESKLYNLGIFDNVQIVPRQPITDQKAESLIVEVRESKRHTLSYSVGFEANRRPRTFRVGTLVLPGSLVSPTINDKTFLSPRVSFDISRRNMRGRDETATLGARVSRLLKRGVFTYADPRFLHGDWASLFTLFGERNSEIRTFTATRFEPSFQLEKHPNPATTILLRYSFRRIRLANINIPQELVPRESRSARLSTPSIAWVRDTRDRPLDASTGNYFTMDFGMTPKLLGSATSFVRFLGQAAHYRPVFGSTVWANSVRLGMAKPFGGTREIPLSERFYAGGSTSLRGFPTNEAGPQQRVSVTNAMGTFAAILPVGGDTLFILNSELRFPLPLYFVPGYKNLGAVLFYDGGNVFNKFSQPALGGPNVQTLTSRGYTNTVGIGLRYKTPIGPIRVDFGRNLNPTPGLSQTQFFITLGQAF
jgi:outer membrane protein assembly factor BamA